MGAPRGAKRSTRGIRDTFSSEIDWGLTHRCQSASANMDKARDMASICRPVSTQIFTERAINPKFDGITTEEMVRELVDRKQAHVEQLSAVVALFDAPPAHRPIAKTEGQPRPVPALPPAPKAAPAV